jgi:hypothetical protein
MPRCWKWGQLHPFGLTQHVEPFFLGKFVGLAARLAGDVVRDGISSSDDKDTVKYRVRSAGLWWVS